MTYQQAGRHSEEQHQLHFDVTERGVKVTAQPYLLRLYMPIREVQSRRVVNLVIGKQGNNDITVNLN